MEHQRTNTTPPAPDTKSLAYRMGCERATVDKRLGYQNKPEDVWLPISADDQYTRDFRAGYEAVLNGNTPCPLDIN